MILVDRVSKLLVTSRVLPGESIEVIPGLLLITHVKNPGVAFGLLSGLAWVSVPISAAAAVAVVLYVYRSRRNPKVSPLGLGLGLGGVVGNLADRVMSGVVTDFVDVRVWPVFNLADAAIVIALIMAGAAVFGIPLGRAGDSVRENR